jgi:hypothetical protein
VFPDYESMALHLQGERNQFKDAAEYLKGQVKSLEEQLL